jgi:peptide deformylase
VYGYELTTVPNPILRQECREVEDYGQLNELLYSMHDIMSAHGGVGIAAPQVGDDRKVMLAQTGGVVREYINPEVVESRGYQPSIEGCLSIPGRMGFKLRRYSVTVNYQDRFGEEHEDTYKGFDAVVLQHEIDHLHGRLMTDWGRRKEGRGPDQS